MSKLADEERGIHEKFKDFGRNAKEWMRKCVLLLPEIERLKIWEKKGFGSIFEYAAKIAGMSREKVNEGLRIMKKTENLPELRKVVEEKGIWAVSPVVCIATPENDRELAQKARGMSKNTLEVYAKGIRGSGGALPRKSGVLPLFTMSADLTEVADVESLLIVADSEVCWKLKKLKGDGEWNDLMRVLVNLWEEKLALEKPTAVKTVSRHIPSAIRRFVLKRSNYKCEFPGCSKHYSELHHADRFGVTWLHDPDRLFALCKAHHQLAHDGLIKNEKKNIPEWRVRDVVERSDPRWVDRLVMRFRAAAIGRL